MKRIAKFEKISFNEFKKSFNSSNLGYINSMYENIKLPTRATSGSAGFDFYLPYGIVLDSGRGIKIPTGIRVKIDEGWFLGVLPKSGLGFKYRLQLDNTLGIIDSDYYFSDNEGAIFAKITNDSKEDKTIVLNAGDSFMQGIFLEFGITVDDNVIDIRNGGFGSTSNK